MIFVLQIALGVFLGAFLFQYRKKLPDLIVFSLFIIASITVVVVVLGIIIVPIGGYLFIISSWSTTLGIFLLQKCLDMICSCLFQNQYYNWTSYFPIVVWTFNGVQAFFIYLKRKKVGSRLKKAWWFIWNGCWWLR